MVVFGPAVSLAMCYSLESPKVKVSSWVLLECHAGFSLSFSNPTKDPFMQIRANERSSTGSMVIFDRAFSSSNYHVATYDHCNYSLDKDVMRVLHVWQGTHANFSFHRNLHLEVWSWLANTHRLQHNLHHPQALMYVWKLPKQWLPRGYNWKPSIPTLLKVLLKCCSLLQLNTKHEDTHSS